MIRVFITGLFAAGIWAQIGCSEASQKVDSDTQTLLRESGGESELRRSPLKEGGNLVVGHAPLQYDVDFNCETDKFRMAIMFVAKDGRRVRDFFSGLSDLASVGDAVFVGRGNARHAVPKMWASHKESHNDVRVFAEAFPDFIERDFDLTFKEFSGCAYYLRDVPVGRAFIWIQTVFDGNRVTQYPIVIDFSPEPGTINRVDIQSGDFSKRFHTL